MVAYSLSNTIIRTPRPLYFSNNIENIVELFCIRHIPLQTEIGENNTIKPFEPFEISLRISPQPEEFIIFFVKMNPLIIILAFTWCRLWKFNQLVWRIIWMRMLSGCRFFRSWAPASRKNPERVGLSRRRIKALRRGQRQQRCRQAGKILSVLACHDGG